MPKRSASSVAASDADEIDIKNVLEEIRAEIGNEIKAGIADVKDALNKMVSDHIAPVSKYVANVQAEEAAEKRRAEIASLIKTCQEGNVNSAVMDELVSKLRE